MRRLFAFPNPVNEVAARTVAAGVVVIGLLTLVTGSPWLFIALAAGFVARVLTGPTLSPLGQLATRVVAPALPYPPKLVDGPPKRFAQGIGATLSVAAVVARLGFGAEVLSSVLVAAIVVAAFLEAVFAFCLGCKVFAILIRIGVVPATVCADCADITRRPARVAA